MDKIKPTKKLAEQKDNIVINVKDEPLQIVKKEEGVYHDGKQLLYEKDEEFEVRSCCGSHCAVEKGYLEFISKFVISSAVLSFSMYQLALGEGDTSYFASTISLILGIYINNNDEGKTKKTN